MPLTLARWRTLAILLAMLLAAATGSVALRTAPSHAATASTIYPIPTDDAMVNEHTADTNEGTIDNVNLTGTVGYRKYGYFRFKVSSLPSGAVLTSVNLMLTARLTMATTVNVHPISGPWTETTVTYNNRPTMGTTTLASLTNFTAGARYAFPITNMVTGNGTWEFGLDTPAGGNTSFYTKEHGVDQPVLRIDYSVPAVNAKLVPAQGAWWGDYVSSNTSDVVPRENLVGRKFDITKFYHDWNDTFPTAAETQLVQGGRFLYLAFNTRDFSNSANNTCWGAVANGSQDANIVRIANNVKAAGYKLFLSFAIEPEGSDGTPCNASSQVFGSAADFIGAWQRIYTVFQQQAVSNAVWVWNVTGGAPSTAFTFYPGDQYVDWIAWDPYNWYDCSGHNDPWIELSTKASTFYNYAMSNGHGNKPFMLSEFGSDEANAGDGHSKGTWFRNIAAAVAVNQPNIKAFVYFDRGTANPGCLWNIDSSTGSLSGYTDAGHNAYFNQPHS